MKKLLLSLTAFCTMTSAFASSPAKLPISCNNGVTISETSTLADVQKCNIVKQKTSDGMLEVKFKDNNDHTYYCYFATKDPTQTINKCES